MIVDEAVRGHVPPAWFWALPGIDRIRAFDQSQLPSPPIARLLGIPAGLQRGSSTGAQACLEHLDELLKQDSTRANRVFRQVLEPITMTPVEETRHR